MFEVIRFKRSVATGAGENGAADHDVANGSSSNGSSSNGEAAATVVSADPFAGTRLDPSPTDTESDTGVEVESGVELGPAAEDEVTSTGDEPEAEAEGPPDDDGTVMRPESESTGDGDLEGDADRDPEHVADEEAEVDAVPAVEDDVEPDAEVDAEVDVEPDAEVEDDVEPDVEVYADAEVEVDAEVDVEPDAEADVEVDEAPNPEAVAGQHEPVTLGMATESTAGEERVAAPAAAVVPAGSLGIRDIAFYVAVAAALAVTSAAIGYLLSTFVDEIHGAETDILYELDANLEAGFLREDRRLTTQVVTIESRAVLGPAADSIGMNPDDLREALTVDVIDGSEIIRVQARGGTPEQALDRLAAVVDTYLAQLEAADPGEAALAIVNDELALAIEEQESLERELAAFTGTGPAGSARLDVLLSELETVRSRRISLEAQQNDQRLEELVKPRFTVLTPAFVLDEPLAPKPLQAIALGGLVGAGLAGGFVFLAERRRVRRFRGSHGDG